MHIVRDLTTPLSRFDSLRIDFAASWPAWFVALCLVFCVIAMIWTWRTVRRIRRRSVRWAILALRGAILACALVLLLEPQVELRKSARIKNRVAVLADVSASMSVKDQPGRAMRSEMISDFLRRNASYFSRLEDQFDVSYFSFGQSLSPAERSGLQDSAAPTQTATDLTGALRSLGERYGASPPKAVFLFSDGADNATSTSAQEKRKTLDPLIAQLQAPIFAFAPAASKDFRDLAVSSVEFEDFAFARTSWTAYAVIKAVGFKGKPVPVSLMQGQSVIATHTITPAEEVASFRVKLNFVPFETGKTVLAVSIPVHAEEALDANNVFHLPIRVIRDKTRILHLCGRPSWDERFLRQVLKQDPNVDLVSLFILRTPTDYRAVPASELSLIPFPENALYAENLREFDLVIFQNFNYKPYGLSRHLPNIRKAVQEFGCGLVMIGGDLSFSEGQYSNTPIADVLPVEVSPEREQTDAAAFSPRLTDAGRHHPVTALDTDTAVNEKTWADLPPLAGCNKVLGLRTGAVALAIHPSVSVAAGPMPVIAAMEAGKGRVLAVMTDSTWVWGLPAVAQIGTSRHYFTFWHNAIRWLIKDPELGLVKIHAERSSYEPGERVQASVLVLDRSYKPAPGIPVRLKLDGPAAPSPSLKPDIVTNDSGYGEITFVPGKSGVYGVEAVATLKDGSSHAAAETLLVQSTGPELRDIAADRELLEYMAGKSGGRVIELPANNFPAGIRIPDPYVARVLEKEDITLWDNWVVFALLVGMLSCEWWLRKRAGLP